MRGRKRWEQKKRAAQLELPFSFVVGESAPLLFGTSSNPHYCGACFGGAIFAETITLPSGTEMLHNTFPCFFSMNVTLFSKVVVFSPEMIVFALNTNSAPSVKRLSRDSVIGGWPFTRTVMFRWGWGVTAGAVVLSCAKAVVPNSEQANAKVANFMVDL